MTGLLLSINKNLKRLRKEKGQGIVEFALLCAFCAAIGLFARDAGFSDAINDSIDKSKPELLSAAIGLKLDKSYMYYFNQWKDSKSTDLKKIDNAERIKADQKALVKIAETYLGKSQSQVLDLMNYYSNSTSNPPPYVNDLKCENANGTGFSTGVLVPLSYKLNSLDKEHGYLWLEANNNQNTVRFLAEGSEVYDKYDKNNPAKIYENQIRTVVTDRLFYSNDILTNGTVTVSVRLHYTDGVVDSIDISARKGGWNNNAQSIGEGLCLHVSDTGYKENIYLTGEKDVVRDPWVYEAYYANNNNNNN